jgi:hypothetical protein
MRSSIVTSALFYFSGRTLDGIRAIGLLIGLFALICTPAFAADYPAIFRSDDGFNTIDGKDEVTGALEIGLDTTGGISSGIEFVVTMEAQFDSEVTIVTGTAPGANPEMLTSIDATGRTAWSTFGTGLTLTALNVFVDGTDIAGSPTDDFVLTYDAGGTPFLDWQDPLTLPVPTAATWAAISGLSTTLAENTYTISAGVQAVFEDSGGNPILSVDEATDTVGIGATPSTLDTLDVDGSIFLEHTSIATDDHAFEIDVDAAGFGDVHAILIEYISGIVALGEDETIILINLDETLATGGDIIAFEILSTTGAATVYGTLFGAGVNPILHLSGVFVDASAVFVLAVDQTVALSGGGAGNVSIFVADNDTVTVRFTTKFEELEFLLGTVSSGAGIAPTFEFSTGPGTWAFFTPTDGTAGMRASGVIQWLDTDIPSWAVGTSGQFEIRVTRTRNVLTTTPIADLVQVAAVVMFSWDKEGDVFIHDLHVNAGGTAGSMPAGTIGTFESDNLTSDDAFVVIQSGSAGDARIGLGSGGTILGGLNWDNNVSELGILANGIQRIVITTTPRIGLLEATPAVDIHATGEFRFEPDAADTLDVQYDGVNDNVELEVAGAGLEIIVPSSFDMEFTVSDAGDDFIFKGAAEVARLTGGAVFSVGLADTTAGVVSVAGDSATAPGEVRAQNPADWDALIEYWYMTTTTTGLEAAWGNDNNGDLLTLGPSDLIHLIGGMRATDFTAISTAPFADFLDSTASADDVRFILDGNNLDISLDAGDDSVFEEHLMRFKSGSVVGNESSQDVDLRWESDNQASLVIFDAGLDRVRVKGATSVNLVMSIDDSSGNSIADFHQTLSTFNANAQDRDYIFEGAGDPVLLTTNAGTDRVGVGTSGPASKFEVVDSSTTQATGRFENNATGDGKTILELAFPADSTITTNDAWIKFINLSGTVGDIDLEVVYNGFRAAHNYRAANIRDARSWQIGMLLRTTGVVDDPSSDSLITRIARVELTGTIHDPAVLGVFGGLKRSEGWRDAVLEPDPDRGNVLRNLPWVKILAIGDGVILVSDFNGEVGNGDLVSASPIPGIGMNQGDQVFRSSTVAKVYETIDWNDRTRTQTVEHDGNTFKVALLGCTYHGG